MDLEEVVAKNKSFDVIVQTGTEVVSLELTNEYGNSLGKVLKSRVVDGDTVTWTYSTSIGSKGTVPLLLLDMMNMINQLIKLHHLA